MLFWPVVAIAFIALIVVFMNVAFPHALEADGASEHLMYLVLMLMVVLVWGFRRKPVKLRPAALMGSIWLAGFSALVVAYTYRDEARMVMDRIRGEVSPTVAIARSETEVELRKAWDGHFRAIAKVNGAKVGMLVDTGASIVLLTFDDARTAGLSPETLDFSQPVVTANGRAYVAPIMLDEVAIGAVSLYGVKAAVAERDKLHSSLLGMSFLGRLTETSFRRDRLTLKN